jgi:hypothetical protein
MRLTSVLLFLAALGSLAVAAYASNPLWRIGLAASAVLFTWFALAVIAALLENVDPDAPHQRWGYLAIVAELGALVLSRVAPLGSLPEQPLVDLVHSGLSMAGIALCIGGVGLALAAMRSRAKAAGVLSGLAMLGALIALSPWLARLL